MKIEDNRSIKQKYVCFDDIEPGTVFKSDYDRTRDLVFLKLCSNGTGCNAVDLTENRLVSFAYDAHVDIINAKVVIE